MTAGDWLIVGGAGLAAWYLFGASGTTGVPLNGAAPPLGQTAGLAPSPTAAGSRGGAAEEPIVRDHRVSLPTAPEGQPPYTPGARTIAAGKAARAKLVSDTAHKLASVRL